MINNTNLSLKAAHARERGNEFFKKEDYEVAIFFYSKCIELEPDNPIHFSNRSIAYYRFGKYVESLMDAMDASKLDPSNLKNVYRIMKAYKALGDEENYRIFEEKYNAMKQKARKQTLVLPQPSNNRCHSGSVKCNSPLNTSKDIENLENSEKEPESREFSEIYKQSQCSYDSYFCENDPYYDERNRRTTNFRRTSIHAYRDVFFLEEGYGFRNNDTSEEEEVAGQEDKKTKQKKEKSNYISMQDIKDDLTLMKPLRKLFKRYDIPSAIQVQRENKHEFSYSNNGMNVLENNTNEYFVENDIIYEIDIPGEVTDKEIKNSVLYLSVIKKKCALLIKHDKIKTALCEICRLINGIFDFFDKHMNALQCLECDNELNSLQIHKMDLEVFKSPRNVYRQAHKLLIQSYLWYIAYSSFFKEIFYRPSKEEVELLIKSKGKIYMTEKQLTCLIELYWETL